MLITVLWFRYETRGSPSRANTYLPQNQLFFNIVAHDEPIRPNRLVKLGPRVDNLHFSYMTDSSATAMTGYRLIN